MGEVIPFEPPSGNCPECLADIPEIMYGRVTIPLAGMVFEGLMPKLYCNSQWVYIGVYFCVEEDNHVSLMTWGGYWDGKVHSCGSPGSDCWPFASCTDWGEAGSSVTLEVAGRFPPC